MENFYFAFSEFGALFTSLLIFFKERKNKKTLEILFLTFLYGLFLEILNVHLSGAYSYSKEFIFRIFDVPIAVGIGWLIVYYCARKISEVYPLKWWQAPFLMALVALSIDLTLDIIAIRLGFWKWRIPLNQEWFGVPYDNFFGWMAVIWTFALLVNFSEQNFFSHRFSRLIKYLAVVVSPLLLGLQITGYANLSAILSGKFSAGQIFEFYRQSDFSYGYYPEVQTFKMYIFWLIVAVIAIGLARHIYKNRRQINTKVDWFSFSILSAMYLLFLAAIFTTGFYKQMPIFIIIAVSTLVFHLIVGLWPKIKEI